MVKLSRFFTLFCLLALPSMMQAWATPSFSQEEMNFIAKKKSVIIGVVNDNEPYSFFRDGTEWERVNMESLVSRIKQIQKMTAVFFCEKGRAHLNGLKASERTFFENYNAFLVSVRSRDIDSLVPYNVVADMFSRLAEKFGEN